MVKYFAGPTSYDFTIVDDDDGGVVGHLRVRPNAVLWKPRNHRRYYRVTIEELAEFAENLNVLRDH